MAATFTYDTLNRMTLKVVPESAGLDPLHSRDVYYGYDLRNLQTYARFDSASGEGVTSVYDGFGRPLSSSINLGPSTGSGQAVTRTLAYQHDRGGNRTRLTHPDGVQFNYSYDGLHRPVFVTDSAIALNHVYRPGGTTAGFGRIGASTGMLVTPDGRLSILHHYEGSQFDVTWTFAHNPAGQVAAETRTNDAYAWGGHYAVNRAYTANGLNQYSAAGGAALGYLLAHFHTTLVTPTGLEPVFSP